MAPATTAPRGQALDPFGAGQQWRHLEAGRTGVARLTGSAAAPAFSARRQALDLDQPSASPAGSARTSSRRTPREAFPDAFALATAATVATTG